MPNKRKNNTKIRRYPKRRVKPQSLLCGPFTLRKAALILFALITACGVYNFAPGRVVKVADGDTITVFNHNKEMEKIRLYGIDAPESQQAWGAEAKAFASELVFLQDVEINLINVDRYGRSVALVRLADGRILNEELLRHGHAWVYRDYCSEIYCNNWILMEQDAKRRKAGLWSQKNPVAPWNWRKQNK